MGAEEPINKINGDGLLLKLHSNEQTIEIRGDGCNVTMKKNTGNVRMIGDGCRLKIGQNSGNVEYIGDGGEVFLGSKSTNDKVKYVGDGGKVNCKRRSRSSETRKEQISMVKLEQNQKTVSENRSKTVEDMDNKVNAMKEAKKKHGRVVKIVTTLKCDDLIVNRWFVSPRSVVKSFNGASFVEIASVDAKTKIEVK